LEIFSEVISTALLIVSASRFLVFLGCYEAGFLLSSSTGSLAGCSGFLGAGVSGISRILEFDVALGGLAASASFLAFYI
jgi:hypothetical protein